MGTGESNDRKRMVVQHRGSCSLFSHPIFVGVVLDAGEVVGVVIGCDGGLRKGR